MSSCPTQILSLNVESGLACIIRTRWIYIYIHTRSCFELTISRRAERHLYRTPTSRDHLSYIRRVRTYATPCSPDSSDFSFHSHDNYWSNGFVKPLLPLDNGERERERDVSRNNCEKGIISIHRVAEKETVPVSAPLSPGSSATQMIVSL